MNALVPKGERQVIGQARGGAIGFGVDLPTDVTVGGGGANSSDFALNGERVDRYDAVRVR